MTTHFSGLRRSPRRVLLLSAVLGLLLAGVPGVASAAGKPDLVVTKVTASLSSVAQGGTVRLKDWVLDQGKAKAGRSVTRYYLSSDKARSKSDTVLGKRSVGTLKPGDTDKGAVTATVPDTVTPASYWVIACADAKKKVAESNEANNCKAASKQLEVTASGGGEFPKTPDPLSVTSTTLDTAHAVSATVFPSSGGNLTTTGADGTTYTLHVPGYSDGNSAQSQGLLTTETITMTPLSGVGGLPLSGGLKAGVQLEPAGLQFLQPVTMTITAPDGQLGPVADQAPFLYHQGGSDFHLYPVLTPDEGAPSSPDSVKIELTHFSTTGVGSGTAADRANIEAHPAARTQAQLEQEMAGLTAKERQSELAGNPPSAAFGSQFQDLMNTYYDQVVLPKLTAAETDDTQARDAISGALSWARQMALLGLDDKGRTADMWQAIEVVLTNAVNKSYNRCVQNHALAEIVKLIAFERTAQLLGLNLGGAFDKAQACAHFEVRFDTTLTEQQSWPLAGHQSGYDLNASFGMHAPSIPVDWTGNGAGPLTWNGFSYHSVSTYDCGQNPDLESHEDGTTTVDGQMRASLQLDLNSYEKPPGVQSTPIPDGKLILLPGTAANGGGAEPTESYTDYNTGCTSSGPTTITGETRGLDLLRSFHAGDFAGIGITIPVKVGDQNADLLEVKDFNQSRGDGTLSGGIHETEATHILLYHTPQPPG